MSFNLLSRLFFFLRKLLALLNLKQYCRGSVSHGDIRFWFSGSVNTGRLCLLLQVHLSY